MYYRNNKGYYPHYTLWNPLKTSGQSNYLTFVINRTLPIYVSGKTIGYFLWVLHFLIQDFRFHIFHFCIYPTTWLIITKSSCSGWINISIIKISHKMLKKAFWSLLCKGYLWAVDRAGICDSERSLEIIENDRLKSRWFGLALILLKLFAQIYLK